jgi:hypothetical protein
MKGIIDGFGIIRGGFVLFNSNSMPVVGTKIKVEYPDGTQEYRVWEGVPLRDENGNLAVFYRECDPDEDLERLMDVYYVVQSYVLHGRFSDIGLLIRMHLEHTQNVSTLKTLLVATKSLKNNEHIAEVRVNLIEKFEKITGRKLV